MFVYGKFVFTIILFSIQSSMRFLHNDICALIIHFKKCVYIVPGLNAVLIISHEAA